MNSLTSQAALCYSTGTGDRGVECTGKHPGSFDFEYLENKAFVIFADCKFSLYGSVYWASSFISRPINFACKKSPMAAYLSLLFYPTVTVYILLGCICHPIWWMLLVRVYPHPCQLLAIGLGPSTPEIISGLLGAPGLLDNLFCLDPYHLWVEKCLPKV